jgi:hypothetical protein
MPGNKGYGLFFKPINVRLGTQNRISSGSLGMSGVGGKADLKIERLEVCF